MKSNCADCRFFQKADHAAVLGECRINPPSSVPGNGWPRVDRDDWCGHWSGTDEWLKKQAHDRQAAIAANLKRNANL